MKMDYPKKLLPAKLSLTGWVLLGIGLLILILAFLTDRRRAMFDYLWIFVFMVSIGVGSLALVSLEYIAGATWSTPFRRISEFFSAITPFLVILAIPLLFGLEDIFLWTNRELVSHDEILLHQAPYLNVTGLIIRTAVILTIWILFYFLITRSSEKQDINGDIKYTKRNNIFSALFTPLFLLTATVIAVDWIMSLEPHWHSTIFGAYYFAGTAVGAISATTLAAVYLKESGYMDDRITKQHFYSLGAWMFAFNMFWAYIAFSQYLLIWYADLPDETSWLQYRWNGSWKYISIATIFIHFVIPFLVLISRGVKTNLKVLKVMSIWLLAAHALDLYWLVMPMSSLDGAPIGWQELCFPFIVTGLAIIVFKLKADRTNLIPVKDPKLESGFNFKL